MDSLSVTDEEEEGEIVGRRKMKLEERWRGGG